jgi:oligopeptidase A
MKKNNLPDWHTFDPKDCAAKLLAAIEVNSKTLAGLDEAMHATDLAKLLAQMDSKLQDLFGPLKHLHAVRSSPILREVYDQILPPLIRYGLEVEQNPKIYAIFKRDLKELKGPMKRMAENMILSQELSGIALDADAKSRFNALKEDLSKLSTQFSNNVLDATKAFGMELKTKEDVGGLNEPLLKMFWAFYKNRHPDSAKNDDFTQGPWLVGLDQPSYVGFMQNSTRRDLREKLYKASIQRAYKDAHDNTVHAKDILRKRAELARLLSKSNYVELSLASKMASSDTEITHLLDKLRDKAKTVLKSDLAKLKEFSGLEDLQPWDMAFVMERYKEHHYAMNAEKIKEYFPFDQVLAGLFSLCNRLFAINIQENTTVSSYLPEVKYYDLTNQEGEVVAGFYLDPFVRPEEKRGGAWMDECKVKSGESIPVAYLVCNFDRPTQDRPALLPFRDVETLYHEFGHGLHHMLTQIEVPQVSGINGVEWDAVELPSQFLENFCLEETTFFAMARHFLTQEPMARSEYEKLKALKHFGSAWQTLRQLRFAYVDLKLHHLSPEDAATVDMFEIDLDVQHTLEPIKASPEDRFLCAFSHIFAGGYAAGYYSYKWAEVLSADAFSAFDNQNIERMGASFKENILSKGGSEHPLDLFKSFRGRAPKADALIDEIQGI